MKKYFEGLNTLRFIGAFSVIIGHIELIKSFYGISNLMNIPFYKYTNGHIGVILFFVLSGFLITYFLLEELKNNNRIDIKKFYIKRLLRIWPIYYLMILTAIFILPKILFLLNHNKIDYTLKDYIYYLLFLPNIAKANLNFIPGATHLWSLGVEEQFYLIWPLLIYKFRKNLLVVFTLVFLVISLIPPFIDFIYVRSISFQNFPLIKGFLSSLCIEFKINAMALGGLIAYIHHSKYKIPNFILTKSFEVLTIVIVFSSWILGINYGVYSDEIYAFGFSLIIFSLTYNRNSIMIFKNVIIDYLGKISYGLYVYHWIVIVLIIEILKAMKINFNKELILTNCIIYSLSIGLTICISHFSYKYLELFFTKKGK